MKRIIFRKRMLVVSVMMAVTSLCIITGFLGGSFVGDLSFLNEIPFVIFYFLIFVISIFFIGHSSTEDKPFYRVEDIKKGVSFVISESFGVNTNKEGFVSGYFYIYEETTSNFFILYISKKDFYAHEFCEKIPFPLKDDSFVKMGKHLHTINEKILIKK